MSLNTQRNSRTVGDVGLSAETFKWETVKASLHEASREAGQVNKLIAASEAYQVAKQVAFTHIHKFSFKYSNCTTTTKTNNTQSYQLRSTGCGSSHVLRVNRPLDTGGEW
jgi:hypothetical protein